MPGGKRSLTSKRQQGATAAHGALLSRYAALDPEQLPSGAEFFWLETGKERLVLLSFPESVPRGGYGTQMDRPADARGIIDLAPSVARTLGCHNRTCPQAFTSNHWTPGRQHLPQGWRKLAPGVTGCDAGTEDSRYGSSATGATNTRSMRAMRSRGLLAPNFTVARFSAALTDAISIPNSYAISLLDFPSAEQDRICRSIADRERIVGACAGFTYARM